MALPVEEIKAIWRGLYEKLIFLFELRQSGINHTRFWTRCFHLYGQYERKRQGIFLLGEAFDSPNYTSIPYSNGYY